MTTPPPELSKGYEPTEVEARWYAFWLERDLFRADPTSSRPPFSIVLPPPNVTGSLHLGHALTATIQDVLIRWKRMSGFECLWLPGTDHAGIATQMVVEKELKRTEKKSRHELGRERFLERVWEWKERYGKRIGEQHKVLGASLDWSRERFTMDAGLSAAVKEVFVRLHEEGLVYRAQKLINWCPSCHTALSDLEVEHEEKQGSLWHLRYPVKGSERHLTVATTRPETMLGDTAVAVHPEDPRYRELIGGTVVLPLVGREIPVIADAELVNPEFGTGVVKVTPAHDFNDYQTGLRHALPMVSILDENAHTNREAGPYAGLERYAARQRVLEDLTQQGLLEKEEPHALSVGTCQRCSTVVEPRLSPQWFVKIEPLARPAIQAVEEGRTRFVPETWTSTYFHWMRNIHDWCISRQLWWGHQIPAYYCVDCSPRLSTGALDLARATPVVARTPPTSCPGCGGGRFEQDPDVLDTWFSSGLWPFSTLGWPEDTPELRAFYPTSVMETGHDIIFFWVARMMMMGLHLMKDVPFRTVYLHAMVRDEKGEKMSKTKGNVIDPLDVVLGARPEALAPALRNKFPQGMPAFGADALRFTLAALTQQGRDIKLSLDRVVGYKAFCNKLWNASRFALMNLGEWRPDGRHVRELPLSLADRWILARLERTVGEVRRALEAYAFSEAAHTLYQFVWGDFCDWYIELSKGALYGEDARAKDASRAVLVHCLDKVLRLLHPFMPFITEEIWQKLPLERAVASIMLAPYPEGDARLEDAAAEAEMAPVVAAIEGLRTIRGENNLPPQAKVVAHVQSANAATRATLERWRAYLVPLAGLSEVHIGEPGHKPPQSAAHVGAELELYVPLAGLVDFEAERERLGKEMARVEQEQQALARKLDNPNFVARAPAEVVARDRERVQELEQRKVKLREHLEVLAPPAAPQAPAPAAQEAGGEVDLREELKAHLADVKVVPEPQELHPHVAQALEQLREETREGLTPEDRRDLGTAYMQMGLVDDAVREFAEARKGAGSGEGEGAQPAPARKPRPPRKAAAAAAKRVAPAVKSVARGGRAGDGVRKKVSAGARKAAAGAKKAAAGARKLAAGVRKKAAGAPKAKAGAGKAGAAAGRRPASRAAPGAAGKPAARPAAPKKQAAPKAKPRAKARGRT